MIEPQLTELSSAGLIRLSQEQPEFEYLFRPALVQDASYQPLLKHNRPVLHREIGESLERLYPENLEQATSTLARHFDLAEVRPRAATSPSVPERVR